MKNFFLSVAVIFALAVVFVSCKDDPKPVPPPVVEDVLGSYASENLALTVTGATPGAAPEVVLLKSEDKTKVRLKNVVPDSPEFTINEVIYSAVETKAYASRLSGTETSNLVGYTVEFTGSIDAAGKMTASIVLTEIPSAPIADVAPLASTYKGQLVVNVNGSALAPIDQRVYVENGSKYSSDKSRAKLTIKNLSIMDMTISQIQLNNLVVNKRGEVALIDSVGFAYNLPSPLSMKALIDVKGTIVDKKLTLSLKIALVDDPSMKIGVGFDGSAVAENKVAKIESIVVTSPAIVKNYDNTSTYNTFTVLGNAAAKDLLITPKVTLGADCSFKSITTIIGGVSTEIKADTPIDFSKFTSEDDEVLYVVQAQDPNTTKSYHLSMEIIPFAKDSYTFTEWTGNDPQGWANSNGAASLIPMMGAHLWPKDAEGNAKPLPVTQSSPGVARVASRMTTGKLLGALGFIPAVTAGTLFLGEFQINLQNTLKSTKFGLPFGGTAFPKTLEVDWSYKAGAKYYVTNGAKDADGVFQAVANDDENKTLMTLKPDAPADKGSVVAVIFEVADYTADFLDGTNVKTATNIAAVASLEKTTNATMMTETAQFQVVKPFDAAKKYKIAIVFSSSAKGDNFEGGEDSELFVKSVKLNY